jgi:HK97 family phage major capsid protein
VTFSLVEQIKSADRRTRGIHLGRYIQSLAMGKGFMSNTLSHAAAHYGDTPGVLRALELSLKGAVAAGSGGNAQWAAPLVLAEPIATEFAELIGPLTVLGRAPFRPVPFNISFGRTSTAAGAGWIGEGNPIPCKAMAFGTVNLTYNKAGCISVVSNELAANSSPQASSIIGNDLVSAAAKFCDQQLLDPGVAAVAGDHPASLTHAATKFVSSGNSFANVVSDLKLLMKHFTDNEIPLSQSMFIMSERVAVAWATLTNTNSDFCFENLGVTGGNIFQIPVLTTAYALDAGSSPTEECVTLVHPNSVAVADAGTAIDLATRASIVMDTAPSSPAQLHSLWQANETAIRSIRYIDYKMRRDAAICVLTGINL